MLEELDGTRNEGMANDDDERGDDDDAVDDFVVDMATGPWVVLCVGGSAIEVLTADSVGAIRIELIDLLLFDFAIDVVELVKVDDGFGRVRTDVGMIVGSAVGSTVGSAVGNVGMTAKGCVCVCVCDLALVFRDGRGIGSGRVFVVCWKGGIMDLLVRMLGTAGCFVTDLCFAVVVGFLRGGEGEGFFLSGF